MSAALRNLEQFSHNVDACAHSERKKIFHLLNIFELTTEILNVEHNCEIHYNSQGASVIRVLKWDHFPRFDGGPGPPVVAQSYRDQQLQRDRRANF